MTDKPRMLLTSQCYDYESTIDDGGILRWVGYIQLVDYSDGTHKPHLEFAIKNTEYRNKGIMSEKLPEFLKICETKGFNQMIALVEPPNVPSIKLLEKNNFVYLKDIDGVLSYATDLRMEMRILENAANVIFPKQTA